jgi:hypothetical protein
MFYACLVPNMPGDPLVPLFETVTDLSQGAETLRRRRFGMIEVADGRLRRVLLRPWPKISSAPEILLLGRWHHQRRPGDRVRLYYNQPWRFPNFLAVTYLVSSRATGLGSVCRALAALDEIARLKRTDALLCDVGNWRISTKLLARWGWEPHCPSRWHRHYIKRFYGRYPPRPEWLDELLGCASPTMNRGLSETPPATAARA